jgi:hypothetical protein
MKPNALFTKAPMNPIKWTRSGPMKQIMYIMYKTMTLRILRFLRLYNLWCFLENGNPYVVSREIFFYAVHVL